MRSMQADSRRQVRVAALAGATAFGLSLAFLVYFQFLQTSATSLTRLAVTVAIFGAGAVVAFAALSAGCGLSGFALLSASIELNRHG